MIEARDIAIANLRALSNNPYTGRGIVMGVSDTGESVQVYWVMGRSENSRNRKLVKEGQEVRTEALDPSKVKDPSLIIYPAMVYAGHNNHIVSNGDQTKTASDYYDQLVRTDDLSMALEHRDHEPDEPNYTPRITGLLNSRRGYFEFSKIVRRPDIGDLPGLYSARFHYVYPFIKPGYGYCLTTYTSDGNPLPTFDRDPYLVLLEGNKDQIAEEYWGNLHTENRVALAVKTIKPNPEKGSIRIINAAD